jgi:hypothetical protein
MSESNKNNPADLWDEDEQYDFAKVENKWVKELNITTKRKVGRVCDSKNEPVFSSMDELNKWLIENIEKDTETWKYICSECDYGTNRQSTLKRHLVESNFMESTKRISNVINVTKNLHRNRV